MLLSDFIGNSTTKNELINKMQTNKMPHAIIIEGNTGLGKQTLAHIIANYFVCSSNENRPCGTCSGCMKAIKNIHPDITVLDGNFSGSLSISSIRNVRASAYIKPNEAPSKVYLLLNCDKMLIPAQNAFLKILEEPPENVVFIMTAVSATSFLQTVRSRSRIYTLYPVSFEESLDKLCNRFPEKSKEDIEWALNINDGNIGLAINTLENTTEESFTIAEKIFRSITLSTEYQLLSTAYRLSSDRVFAGRVIDHLISISAEAVKASVGAKVNLELATDTARRVSNKKLTGIFKKAQEAKDMLGTNVNMNLFCTWLSAHLKA